MADRIDINERLCVRGFQRSKLAPGFVDIRFGRYADIEINMMLQPDEARKLADALREMAAAAERRETAPTPSS